MTRYKILANNLSNMLHEELRSYENKLLIMEPADILDNAWEYASKSNLVAIIDNFLNFQKIDEEGIYILLGSSLEELHNYYVDKWFDVDANKTYVDCVEDYCLKAKEN